MKSAKTSKKTPQRQTLQGRDLPATRGMLSLTRTELKRGLGSLRSEMKAGFKRVDARFSKADARFAQVDARFAQVDARFAQVDARFDQVDARFDQMEARFNQIDARFSEQDAKFDSKFQHVLAEVARIGVLVEEQNANNRIVLEGLSGLWHRQERMEVRMGDFESLVRSIAGVRSS